MRIKILMYFFKTPKVLVLFLVLSITCLVCHKFELEWNRTFGIEVDTARYISLIAFNLSMGYIVSLVFYLVIFFPEKERQFLVKGKTHIIFSRLQNYLMQYSETTLKAFNIQVGRGDDIKKKWFLLKMSGLAESVNS